MDFGSAGNRSVHGTPNRMKRNNRDLRNANRKTLLTQDGMETDERYPSGLSLYSSPPVGDISLEMFEDLAVLRLRVSFVCLYLLPPFLFKIKLKVIPIP